MTSKPLTPAVSAQQQGAPPPDAASADLWLRGHIGHLTPTETQAFADFKALAADKKLYTPATLTTKATHADATLLRFLRARRFVPADALTQFAETERWRKENDLDALYEHISIPEFWESRNLYPQWTGRMDKRGIPVYLFEVHKLNSKRMSAFFASVAKAGKEAQKQKEKEAKAKGGSTAASDAGTANRLLRLFALYENLTRFVMPLCSAVPGREHAETPVDQSNNIVDISKVGLKQFWNLRTHMQDASQLATAHYPETLDRIFVSYSSSSP